MSGFEIDFPGYGISFLLLNIVIIFSAWIGSRIGANRKRFEKREYPESYIRFTLNFKKRFAWRYVLVIVGLEIIFSIIVLLVTKRLGSSEFITYIMIPSILFSIPFSIYYSTMANKEYKKMAIDEGHDIVVDFQHKMLKEIFSIPKEIAASLLVISFTLLFIPFRHSLVIYLYIVLPWFFAATLILTKNYIKPVLKDSYMMIGKMTLIYQGILVLLLILNSMEPVIENSSIAMIITLGALCLFLILKIAFYIPGYKRLKSRLEAL